MVDRSVLVLGGNSIIAMYLLPKLLAAGYQVHVISRKAENIKTDGINVYAFDGENTLSKEQIPEYATVISLLPISLLVNPAVQEVLCRSSVQRIIAFSSTSVLTKRDTIDPNEKELMASLGKGEEALWRVAEIASQNTPAMTLFRPTMIYDGVHDHNVTRIAELIRRYHFFPLIGQGKGLRQPVHADDLAQAILQALNARSSYGKTYTLSGGEILTYRALVERIAAANHLKVQFVPLSLLCAKAALMTAQVLSKRFADVSYEALRRMGQDMIFDHHSAQCDFGFSPREFL